MSISKGDISGLKDALKRARSAMTGAESLNFTARLKAVSIARIRWQLDTRAISRPWKRDLAEAEIARREAVLAEASTAEAVDRRMARAARADAAARKLIRARRGKRRVYFLLAYGGLIVIACALFLSWLI